jgi:hypothetical protein
VADMGAFESQVPPPVAVIRAPSLVLVGRPVRFDGSSSHDPGRGTLTYLWQFGDGNESTAVRPLHTFRHPGTYRVRLTITSSSGAPAGSTSRRIVVSRSPLCVVPGLRGKTLAAARRALRRAHCRLGHVTRQRSSAVRRGRVIGSRPGRRTRLVRDARVALTLSRGRR